MITGSLPIHEGVPYRINELAEIINRSRPTIERYSKRFSFKNTTVEYKGKTVSAVILTAENIEQIATALQQGDDLDRDPIVIGDRLRVTNPLQPDNDPDQADHHRIDMLSSKLEAAQEKINDLQARLSEQKNVYDKLIESKDSEISTLKTSMVMMEQLKRYGVLDVGERKTGALARLGQWIKGLSRHGNPKSTYQTIDPQVEPIKQQEEDVSIA